jgi:16S rRNA (guanine527-N7)-methyltransferase
MSHAERLQAGIAALGLSLPDDAVVRLLSYLALLAKWNRTYNLTAVRREDEMVTHHLLDSLAVLPVVEKSALAGRRLVDVGSGGGLPGLVLAIARPDLHVTSVEASQKKAAFQQQAKIELGLSNVSIHCGRAEDFKGVFDAAISRAFASLADFVRFAGHLSNRLLAMKGVYPADEVAALPPDWHLAASHEISVPGLDARRHLLVLEKA